MLKYSDVTMFMSDPGIEEQASVEGLNRFSGFSWVLGDETVVSLRKKFGAC